MGAGTRLKFALNYHPKGWSVLKEPIAQWVLRKEVGNLESLKEAVERYYRAAAPLPSM